MMRLFNKSVVLFAIALCGTVATAQAQTVESHRRTALPPELAAKLQGDPTGAETNGLPGASWSISLSNDSRVLTAIFVSGTFASGTFLQCPLVPQYLLTVSNDGTTINQYSSNRYNLIFPTGNTCGLYYTFTANPVVGPGQWKFQIDQPGYGAPVVATAPIAACKVQTALYQTYSSAVNDYFYTVSPSQRDIAINTYGYSDMGVTARVEGSQVAGSLPFKRFYKYVPQTDHFYTTSASEEASVLALGWVAEGVEGYLYPTQKPGTVPLYRVSLWNASTGDLQHFYTTSAATRASLIAQGWADDPLAGYACP